MKLFGRVAFVVALVAALLGVIPGGVGAPVKAASGLCQWEHATTRTTISQQNPHITLVKRVEATHTALALCYSNTGPDQATLIGGLAGVTVTTNANPTNPQITFTLISFPDSGTPWPYSWTNFTIRTLVPQPTRQDEPGDDDYFFTTQYSTVTCTAGCTWIGDAVGKTGLLLAEPYLGPAPASSGSGASLLAGTLQLWVDGVKVHEANDATLFGIGVGNTNLPGAPQATTTPGSGICVGGNLFCTGAQVWTPAYSNSVTVSRSGSTTQPVTVPKVCAFDTDTGNCT